MLHPLRVARRRLPLLLVTGLTLLACSAHDGAPPSTSDGAPLSEACVQYLAVYDQCVRGLSPERPQVATDRVSAAREALTLLTDAAQQTKACADGAARLRASCR